MLMSSHISAFLAAPARLADLSRRNPMKAEVGRRQKSDAGRSVSAFHPAAFVYFVYFVVALREITRLRQERIRVN